MYPPYDPEIYIGSFLIIVHLRTSVILFLLPKDSVTQF